MRHACFVHVSKCTFRITPYYAFSDFLQTVKLSNSLVTKPSLYWCLHFKFVMATKTRLSSSGYFKSNSKDSS